MLLFVFVPTYTWSQNQVQHCRFKYEWLIEDYNSQEKIKQQRDLYVISESQKEALLGILHRGYQHGLVITPSSNDLKFLNDLYTHGILTVIQ